MERTTQKHTFAWLPIAFILLQSTLYGFGDPISKAAYEVVPLYSLLSARYTIAFLFLMVIFGRRVVRGLKAADLHNSGTIQVIPFSSIF